MKGVLIMKNIVTEQSASTLKEPATEESADITGADSASPPPSNIFAEQHSAIEGGIPTDLYCPACGEEISGSYLPMFRCPHCNILMFRDDKGHVTNHEQKHTCPECGHAFSDFTDDAPSDFRRACRNLEQKAEGVMLGLDRIVNRILA
jgi:predicted RNA-binding Zn-ribbon protein involved in translation (DUF1610 family)